MERGKQCAGQDDSSSDEELCSYLTTVQKCKPPEPPCRRAQANQPKINVGKVKAVNNKSEVTNKNNSYALLQVNVEVDNVKSMEGVKNCGVEDEALNDKKDKLKGKRAYGKVKINLEVDKYKQTKHNENHVNEVEATDDEKEELNTYSSHRKLRSNAKIENDIPIKHKEIYVQDEGVNSEKEEPNTNSSYSKKQINLETGTNELRVIERNEIHDNGNEAAKDKKEEPNSKLKIDVNVNNDKTIEEKEFFVEDVAVNVKREEPNTENTYCEEQVNLEVENSKPVEAGNRSIEYFVSVEQKIKDNECLDSEITFKSKESHEAGTSLGKKEELNNILNVENVEHNLQRSTFHSDDSKQNSRSPCKRDKYYLINEEDWLTLCARLDNAENVGNVKSKSETDFKDSLAETGLHDCSKSSSVDTKSPNGNSQSLFSAFKQNNPDSKTLLEETHSSQTIYEARERKTSKRSARIRKQIKSPMEHSAPQYKNELNESKRSDALDNQASPDVEIVYVRLEDGNIKYDVKKSPISPAKNTGDTNLNAVRKIDFSPNKAIHYHEGQRPIGVNSSVLDIDNIECKVSGNHNQDTYKKDCSFGDSLYTHACKRQARFVRINNKLTRVYENVKESVIDEVLNSCDHHQNEHLQYKEGLGVAHDNVNGGVIDNDSFNFNDSRLVAFPLNAFDAANINKDDSISQLTPSKLDILNTSCHTDPLTPNMLPIHTYGELCKLIYSSQRNSDLSSPYKFNIIPARDLSDKETYSKNDISLSSECSTGKMMGTETPVVPKATKSGTLIQCESDDISPIKDIKTSNKNTLKIKEKMDKSQLKNLWRTFKPALKHNKRKDASTSAYEDASCDLNKMRTVSESEDNDLASYLSSPIHVNNEIVKSSKLSDLSKNVPHFSVLAQDSCPDLCNKQNLGTKRKPDTETEGKVENVRKRNQRTTKTLSTQTNVSRAVNITRKETIKKRQEKEISKTMSKVKSAKISTYYVQPHGASSTKIIKDSLVSCTSPGRKTQMASFIDCDYKQVDFKDFENESHAVNERKFSVDSKNDETVKHSVSSNTSEKHLKENQENISSIKDVMVPPKKRKITINEENKQNELIQDLERKGQNDVKKLCIPLNNNTQCRRNRINKTDVGKTHKCSSDQTIDDSGIHLDLNEHISSSKESKPQAVITSPKGMRLRSRDRKQDFTSSITITDRQKPQIKDKSDGSVRYKSKSQKQRGACLKKKSEVLPSEDSRTEQLYGEKSAISVSDNASKNKGKRSKPSCLKKIKSGNSQKVNNETEKESGENNLAGSDTELSHHSVNQKNEKENEVKSKSVSHDKRVPGKSKKTRVVKCNTELNSSSSISDLDKQAKNGNSVPKTADVVSSDSPLLKSSQQVDSDCMKQGTMISIVATFEPLLGEDSVSKEENETADYEMKIDTENKDIGESKRKKMKVDKEAHNVKKNKVLSDKKKPKRKQKIVGDLGEEEESQEEGAYYRNDEKQNKNSFPKMIRIEDVKVNDTRKKGIIDSPVKSARKPCSRRKPKSTSKRLEKGSWKDLLDDCAFNLDLNDEKHKPVNIRHMIRKILKTSQGINKTTDKSLRHREKKKEKSHREKKEKIHGEKREKSQKNHKSYDSSLQILTSESDDAWISDSGLNTSFPAFQFTSGSDSETGKHFSKVLGNDDILENTSKLASDKIGYITDVHHCEQKIIELHCSPVNITEMKDEHSTSVNLVSESEPNDSLDVKLGTKRSPEIKKNVDKLIAILDKVGEQKVVKRLEFEHNENR